MISLQALARALEATGWSTVVGFAASLVALVGVPGAVWGARQARNSAEAARRAAEAAALRIRSIEAVSRLAGVVERLDGLIDELGKADGSFAARSARALRRELGEILSAEVFLEPSDRRSIWGVIASLYEVDRPFGSEGVEEQDLTSLRRALSLRLDELHWVLVRLKSRAAKED